MEPEELNTATAIHSLQRDIDLLAGRVQLSISILKIE
jgi:hypothetical protein